MISTILEKTLMDYLTTPIKIAGLVIAVIGLSLCFLAKKITLVKRNQKELTHGDPIYYTTLAIGLTILLVGMVLTIFDI